MYNQNYKVELPQFPDREVSIAEYGAKSGDLQIETGRHNAEAINRAIREVSEQGGGMVRVPAGIWAVAPIRLLSGVNLHLDSQAMFKFIKAKALPPPAFPRDCRLPKNPAVPVCCICHHHVCSAASVVSSFLFLNLFSF